MALQEIYDEYCLRCGYSLRELSELRCPECGLVATDAGIQDWLNEHRSRTVRVLLISMFWLIFYMIPNSVLSGTVDRVPRHGPVALLLLPFLAIPLFLLLMLITWAISYSKDYLVTRCVKIGRRLLLAWLTIHTIISIATYLY